MWWTIRVNDNNITWEHRVLFDKGEFYGTDNLSRMFPNFTEWSAFLAKIMMTPNGELNTVVAGNTIMLSWQRE